MDLLVVFGGGRFNDSGCKFLQMEMFVSFMRATGREEVSLALAVPKLLLSNAIWAALDISVGEVCWTFDGLLMVFLDI